VVPLLIEAFRVVGEKSAIKVEPVERRASELESELRGGRRFDLAYRTISCTDAIADLGQVLCPAFDAPSPEDPLGSAASPRILQLLLELERASDFPTAKGIATQIDRESRTEFPIIPLWQVEQHYAWRSRLDGIPRETDRLYQGIEGWEIRPWFAVDPWMVRKP
jgi:peptide/nickel transport system substrate-binding protein